MLPGEKIAQAGLRDWRKLAQGIHARFLVADFAAAGRFVTAVGESGDALGHHPRVRIGAGHVDMELVTDDAIYRDDDGTEYVVEWVTQQDIDVARRISEIADDQGLRAQPESVSEMELGLDVSSSASVAPVWAALLAGTPEAQGLGSPSDEVRDPSVRVPNLWFDDSGSGEGSGQRFHVEVYVPAEVVRSRIDAALAAGGTIVDDSNSPGLTVIADPEGNRGVLCADTSSAKG